MNTWRRRDETVSVRCVTLGVSELELQGGETRKCPMRYSFLFDE